MTFDEYMNIIDEYVSNHRERQRIMDDTLIPTEEYAVQLNAKIDEAVKIVHKLQDNYPLQ